MVSIEYSLYDKFRFLSVGPRYYHKLFTPFRRDTHTHTHTLVVITYGRNGKYIHNNNRKKLKVREHSGDLGEDARIIWKWVLKKRSVKMWT